MQNADHLATLLHLLERHAGPLAGVTRRKMFGCEAFFRDAAIFALIWKEGRIGLKLPVGASFDEAMALPGALPWRAGTMAMSHWVLVPESFHSAPKSLSRWVVRAHDEALGTMVPSKRRTSATKAAAAKPRKTPPAAVAPAPAPAPAPAKKATTKKRASKSARSAGAKKR
jgi:TfoX/Sxy family transcriptional regulator of competence genes